MCVVSMVTDHFHDRWTQPRPLCPDPYVPGSITITGPPLFQPPIFPSPDEIAEFRKLLEKARQYDIVHNQPDCGIEDKKIKIKKLAEELGVEIDFL
jgi:hypothetical protein